MGARELRTVTIAVVLGLAAAGGSTEECLSRLGSLAVGEVLDVAVVGDLALLAAGSSGLLVVDLQDPTRPAVAGSYRPPGAGVARGVAVAGSFAFVAAGTAGLRVLDLTDPAAPQEVGALSAGACSGVAVADDLAYLAMEDSGLWIVDVSAPRTPALVGVYLYSLAERVSVGGRYAFVAAAPGSCGSRVVDVGDPARPVGVEAPAVGEFNAAAVTGRFAFLVRGCEAGESAREVAPAFSVVDLEAPGGPAQVGTVSLPEDATGVAVSGTLALVAGVDRVFAVEISDPTLPAVAWSHRTATGAGDLALTDDLAVVAGRGESEVLDLAGCPGAFVSAYLMGVGHLEGHAGTQWRTDVEVCNLDPVARSAEMAFLERGRSNLDPAAVKVSLSAGQCTRFEDVVVSLFGLAETAGTIRVTSSVHLPCSARTFTLADEGTYGSFTVGRSGAEAIRTGDTGALVHLSHTASLAAGFRTNMELVNVAGVPTTVEVDLYSAGGTMLGRVVVPLDAYGEEQLGRVFERVYSLDVMDGFAVLRTSSPGGAFLAAAGVVDNLTGDGAVVPVIGR